MARCISSAVASLETYIQTRQADITLEIEKYLCGADQTGQDHIHAARYAIVPEGHRYRSIIALEIYRALRGREDAFLKSAVGLECLHHASLILDDLPCMDNSALRKGKPATHIIYGEAHAILGSLYLWNWGYRLLLENAAEHGCSASAWFPRLYGSLCSMIRGQEIDLMRHKGDEDLRQGMFLKNSLFHLACVLPPQFAGNPEWLAAGDLIGRELSITYQLLDDLRDISSTAITGKPCRCDRDKDTSIYRWGMEAVRREIAERRARIFDHLRAFPGSVQLASVIEYILISPS